MIETKDFIKYKILRANRKYSTLRITDGSNRAIAKFTIEKNIDKSRYRETLDTTISWLVDKYGPLQYRDERYGKNDMCLVFEASPDKLEKLNPNPVLKCDRVTYSDGLIIFDISQHGNIYHYIPSSFTSAISRKDLKELIKTIMSEEE